jgi:hypothetical protein
VQYNTVTGTQKAEGGVKRNEATDEIGTLEILRTVLSDAKFLVALLDHDDTGLIQTLGKACCKPIFEPVLGSRAFLTFNGKMFLGTSYSNDLTEALTVSPWVGNFNDTPPDKLEAIIECPLGQPLPPDYDLMYDSPRLSTPREFFARAVVRRMIEPAKIVLTPNFNKAFVPVNYKSPRWRNIRAERFALDKECVLCGNLPQVCHHKVYINANNERIEELCSLCILCHIAVTMVEHMTGKNIDPCDANWRPSLEAAKRSILAYYGDPYERSACMAG